MYRRCSILASLVLVICLTILTGCQQQPPVTSVVVSPLPSQEPKEIRIAFFISDPDSQFEQAQFNEAKKYAKDIYGAEVLAFDGSQGNEYILKSFDQIRKQGVKMISLALKDSEYIDEEVLKLIETGIAINTYFIPISDTGIPIVSSDESESSSKMGVQMAKKWKEVNPNKPLVIAEFGYPKNDLYESRRTQPFVEGILSVDPETKKLGCLDISKGSDAARLLMLDLCEKHPEVNLIYIEDLKVMNSVMDALNQAGRGDFSEGKTKTEIVCLAECNEDVIEQIYDQNSSIKLAMGLSPVEIAHARIDNLFDIKSGKVKQTEQPAKEINAKVFDISYWTLKKEEAEDWYRLNYGE